MPGFMHRIQSRIEMGFIHIPHESCTICHKLVCTVCQAHRRQHTFAHTLLRPSQILKPTGQATAVTTSCGHVQAPSGHQPAEGRCKFAAAAASPATLESHPTHMAEAWSPSWDADSCKPKRASVLVCSARSSTSRQVGS